MSENNLLLEILSFSSSKGLILLVIFIVFGRLFLVNWKNKNRRWEAKAWISGIITLISFLILAFLPLD